MEQFAEATETDFNFSVPITELLNQSSAELLGEDADRKQGQVEDRSLEEIDVPLSSKWIQQQMEKGELLLVGLTEHSNHQWNEIRVQAEE